MHTYSTNQINKNKNRSTSGHTQQYQQKSSNICLYIQALNTSNKDEQCNEQISNKSLQQDARHIEQCNKRAGINHEEGADIP